MKGLLHSKRFKTNLRKWLFMYVGVMVLLTSVITYSKYITSLQYDDKARTSKFAFEITPTACPTIEESICNATAENSNTVCRPTQVIASCFTVDTTGLEVDSDFYLTLDPALKTGGYYEPNGGNNQEVMYNIIGVDIISNNNPTEIYSSTETKNNEWTPANSGSRLKLQRRIDASKADEWIFRVRMKKDNNGNKIFTENINSSDIVKVGYSMSQITTKEGGNK